MALLVAGFRDPVLRATVPAMLDRQSDRGIPSCEFNRVVDVAFPDKLFEKRMKSSGENTTATNKQSGYPVECRKCSRHRVTATPGSTTLALLLGTLSAAGGYALLESDWVRLLDSSINQVPSEARGASSRGWVEIRHVGHVLEIIFYRPLQSIEAEI